MQVKMITADARESFRTLLLPKVYAAIESGIPVVAIGLVDRKKPVGALAGVLEEGHVFNIMSFYVAPKYRLMGGGSLLIEALKYLLDQEELPVAVLSYVEGDGESDLIGLLMEAQEIIEDTGAEKIYCGTVKAYTDYGFGTDVPEDKDIKKLSELSSVECMSLKTLMQDALAQSKGGVMGKFKPDKGLTYVLTDELGVRGFLTAGHANNREDEHVVFISDVPSDSLSHMIDYLIRDLGPDVSKDEKVIIPVLDDRYKSFFDNIDGVRNIQHVYLL